jgi:hypothetical protein
MGEFDYYVVYKQGSTSEPSSLIAAWLEDDTPLRAVLWSVPDQEWIYAPAIAADVMYDDMTLETRAPIDRETAERIAREHLGTSLPSEEELHRMNEEGARLGHRWGPPRSA